LKERLLCDTAQPGRYNVDLAGFPQEEKGVGANPLLEQPDEGLGGCEARLFADPPAVEEEDQTSMLSVAQVSKERVDIGRLGLQISGRLEGAVRSHIDEVQRWVKSHADASLEPTQCRSPDCRSG